MKKINNIYKKISTWIFRDNLELGKHWWHRLIKVTFLSLFFLVTIGSYIMVISYPNDTEFLSKHNIHINNTLLSYTENYIGEDSDNTIPKFFKQKGSFGILIDNKIEYISSYVFNNSLCLKNPEKYLDNIAKALYPKFLSSLTYQQAQNATLVEFSGVINKSFYDTPTRKCFINLDKTYENINKTKGVSASLINYRPNALFYIEATIAISLIALLSFVLFALIYYRLILYIVYGNKK